MKPSAYEVNFDALVGPTHFYGGLSPGNLASTQHAKQFSNPKEAALQGLKKMKLLTHLGVRQAVLPPQERPYLPFMRQLGFQGDTQWLLRQAHDHCPAAFYAAYSSSGMWVANMATVSSSTDTQDARVHITPANLISNLHRSIEAPLHHQLLKVIFSDKKHFSIHDPLPSQATFSDEGAANHNRLCSEHGKKGVHLFVYGREKSTNRLPKIYPARQTLEASQAIVRLHGLDSQQVLFVKQNPDVIDKGVFHNDVISTVNQQVFLYHEQAFEKTDTVINELQSKVDFPLILLPVSREELSVQEAVESYLFNSQIVTLPDQTMTLIVPMECQKNVKASRVIERIKKEDNPIKSAHFVDCRQSMENGGGPACLRLRVVMQEKEIRSCKGNLFLQEGLYEQLVQWVNRHYRDRLTFEDFLDPQLVNESYTALDELSSLLQLGSLYSFQKV